MESLLHRCRLSSGHQKRIKRRKGAWTPDTDIPESAWARFHDNSTQDDGQRRGDSKLQTEGVRTRTGFWVQQRIGVHQVALVCLHVLSYF